MRSLSLSRASQTRRVQFETARELAASTKELKAALEVASALAPSERAAGAKPLRAALQRAEAAGQAGLLVRKASTRLKELTEIEEAEERCVARVHRARDALA